MFGFNRAIKGLLADPGSADRWLETFPASDPLAMHGGILAELAKLTEPGAKRTPAQLEAVFHVDARTDALRRTLTAQYVDHGNRSTRVENQLWQALFDLTQGFLLCYQAFRREVADHGQSNQWQSLRPEMIAREIIHQGHDAKVRLFRFEQWIPAKWTDLHTLFQTACSGQIERQPVPVLADGSMTTIEQEYLHVLVLQLMNSGNLAPLHLEWVSEHLAGWCASLTLSIEAPTETGFYVDLGSRSGLKRRPPQPLEGRVLFLDTRPLHAMLMQNVVMLEQKIRNNPQSNRTPRRTDQVNLLTKLASQVDPEFRPFARRGERTRATGSVDAILGFAKISGFLGERDTDAVPGANAGAGNYGEAIELATFGRMRNEQSRAAEMVRRRLAGYATPGGAWEIRDVSLTGYRLVAPMGAINTVTLGTLAAIQPHGQALWALGIVRRMKRLTADRAEIGVQLVADDLVSVDLSESKPGDAGDSGDREVPTVSRRGFCGLFLSKKKRDSESPVQTLILPAGEYQPGKRFRMSMAKFSYAVALGRLLEQHPDWTWVTVESPELAAEAAAIVVP